MSSRSTARLQLAAAALLFSTGGAAIKAVDFTAWQITCLRSGIAAVAIFLMTREARQRWTGRTLIVGVAYATTLTLFVLANRLTTAANTIYLQSTAPLYLALLAPWLLREPTRRQDIVFMAAVALGLGLFFVGVDVPAETAPDPVRGNMLALASGLFWALTVCGLRWMGSATGGERGSATAAVVAGNVIACLAALPFALPFGSHTRGRLDRHRLSRCLSDRPRVRAGHPRSGDDARARGVPDPPDRAGAEPGLGVDLPG